MFHCILKLFHDNWSAESLSRLTLQNFIIVNEIRLLAIFRFIEANLPSFQRNDRRRKILFTIGIIPSIQMQHRPSWAFSSGITLTSRTFILLRQAFVELGVDTCPFYICWSWSAPPASKRSDFLLSIFCVDIF